VKILEKSDNMRKFPAWAEDWEGDTQELVGHEDEPGMDDELCEQAFATKQEAFNTGWTLAEAKFAKAA
jgi:hypothetical protein